MGQSGDFLLSTTQIIYGSAKVVEDSKMVQVIHQSSPWVYDSESCLVVFNKVVQVLYQSLPWMHDSESCLVPSYKN
jgi:hypothetical protein